MFETLREYMRGHKKTLDENISANDAITLVARTYDTYASDGRFAGISVDTKSGAISSFYHVTDRSDPKSMAKEILGILDTPGNIDEFRMVRHRAYIDRQGNKLHTLETPFEVLHYAITQKRL